MILQLSQIAEVRPGFPFRSSVEPDPAGDALVVQLRDVSREGGPDWPALLRTRLSGRKPFPFLQDDDILLFIGDLLESDGLDVGRGGSAERRIFDSGDHFRAAPAASLPQPSLRGPPEH